MEWVLMIFMSVSLNGHPAYVPVVIQGPVVFDSKEDCGAKGGDYVLPGTKVICTARPKPAAGNDLPEQQLPQIEVQ